MKPSNIPTKDLRNELSKATKRLKELQQDPSKNKGRLGSAELWADLLADEVVRRGTNTTDKND